MTIAEPVGATPDSLPPGPPGCDCEPCEDRRRAEGREIEDAADFEPADVHPATCHCSDCKARTAAGLDDIPPGADPDTAPLPPLTPADLRLEAEYRKEEQKELLGWMYDTGRKAELHEANTARVLRTLGLSNARADELAREKQTSKNSHAGRSPRCGDCARNGCRGRRWRRPGRRPG